MFDSEASAAIATHKKGRVPRALREEQILDIAEELFLAKGYEQTSIEDICRIAEVSRPTVYNLYDNKGAIYLACVRRGRAEHDRPLRAAPTRRRRPLQDPRAGSGPLAAVVRQAGPHRRPGRRA